MTTLAYERGTVAKLHLGTRAKVRRLIDEAKRTPMGDGTQRGRRSGASANTSPASTWRASS